MFLVVVKKQTLTKDLQNLNIRFDEKRHLKISLLKTTIAQVEKSKTSFLQSKMLQQD